MENILFNYSELFNDDGGFRKVESDLDALGANLVAKAKKIKTDINEAFSNNNVELLKSYEATVESISAQSKQLKEAKAALVKTEKEYNDTIKQQLDIELKKEKLKQAELATTIKEIQGEGALDKAIQQSNNTKKSAITLSKAEAAAIDKKVAKTSEEIVNQRQLTKMSDLYARKNSTLLSIYDKVSAKQQILSKTYRDLLVKQELGISFTARESAQLGTLQSRYEKYDAVLRKAEQTQGKYFRSIGDYKSAYNGLGNSINQLSRELPAFTFSAQTGILALSNNIPILTDEIGRLNKANAELQGQGKKTKSVLTSIFESVFSLQTAMGIGILLFTVYAKEIGEFINDTFSNAAALEKQAKWLEETNKFLKERGEVIKKGSEFEKEIISNYEKQTDALIRLRNARGENDQKNAIEEKSTNLDRIKRIKSNTQEEIKNFEEREKARQKYYVKELARLEALKKKEFKDAGLTEGGKRFLPSIGGETAKEITDRANKRISQLKQNSYKVQEINKLELEELKKQKTELLIQEQTYTEDLEILQEQQRTDRKNFFRDLKEDRLQAQADGRKAELENEISINQEIFASDRFTADQRESALITFIEKSKALAKEERTESLRARKAQYVQDTTEFRKNIDGKIVTQELGAQILLEMERKYGLDRASINREYNKQIADADKKILDLTILFKLEAQKAYFERQRKDLSITSKEWESYGLAISKAQYLIEQLTSLPENNALADNLETSRKELVAISDYVANLEKSLAGRKFNNLSKTEQQKVLKEVEAFEKQKQEIQLKFDKEERDNEIKAIDVQLETEVYGTKRYFELQTKKNKLLIQNQDQTSKILLDKTKSDNKKILDNYDKLVTAILDRVIQLTQRRIQEDQKAIESQKTAIATQEARAAAGLTNTLAFEQKELGKRESRLLQQQKREERLQKIKALYSSYSNYSDKGDGNALLKALRDFSILEAITASFGDGGAADDVLAKIPQNGKGITRGRSHRGQNGGIPVLIEGNEGFFSGREMSNLGKNNFYKVKEMAGAGKMDTNFFSRQRKQFTPVVMHAPSVNEDRIISSLGAVKSAIENQPSQTFDAPKLVDGMVQMVETIVTNNKVVRNTHTKRFRL